MVVVGEKVRLIRSGGELLISEITEAWGCIASDMPFWVVVVYFLGRSRTGFPGLLHQLPFSRLYPASDWFGSHLMATIVEASDITRHSGHDIVTI